MHFTSSGVSTPAMGPRDAAFAFCKLARLKKKSVALLRPDQSPWAFFEELCRREHYSDAIRLLAHRLPKREAIWWGCLCLVHEWGTELAPPAAAAMNAVVDWILDPSEDLRRRAGKLGKAARLSSPAGCLGMAVFSSGGSISLPGLPHVPPKPHVTARSVASAVLLLGARHAKHDQRQASRFQFLELGRQVLHGEIHWEEPVPGSLESDGQTDVERNAVEVNS